MMICGQRIGGEEITDKRVSWGSVRFRNAVVQPEWPGLVLKVLRRLRQMVSIRHYVAGRSAKASATFNFSMPAEASCRCHTIAPLSSLA